jgi:hypothetical protein
MKEQRSLALRFVLGFSLAGFLFSGYLSAVKLFSGACAFNEECPVIWGYPACFYGFILYIVLLALSILAYRKQMTLRAAFITLLGVAFLGVIFAGYLTIIEIPAFVAKGFGAYTFGVPTCFLGLVFFMLIFASSGIGFAHNRE